jgi:hypothetical protein
MYECLIAALANPLDCAIRMTFTVTVPFAWKERS